MLKKDIAVVLVSGGMDSCVTTAIANETFSLALLHINYGQRTEKRELKAFTDIASYYGVLEKRRLVTNLDYFSKIGGSSLTDTRIEVPNAYVGAGLKPAPTVHEIPTTYVPFRNAQFLSIAVSWAEVIGAGAVFIGAVEQDSPGYPDCRQAFYDAFNKLVEVGTKPTLPAPRPNTFYVYAIECANGSIYIGQTDDLWRRWEEHIAGKVKWTKEHRPVKIAHYEEFGTREEVVKREQDLKTGFGRKWLKREIESGRARQAGTHIKVVTPLIGMNKSEIVKKGVSLNAPLHLSWSCYKNNDIACGQCHSCVLRLTAFSETGVKDTVPYLL
ncbi:MAG TPA: 7-cyano-7-deazaguanine synthase [Candidatus Brocadiales bacterium]|nr:7-cyano-7-deazaguanine synthase [Candidatus Brocadiales bacterium]